MKNTAAELYFLSPEKSYPHAFTFIRMLAVHLRNVVRSSTSGKVGDNQEAFRAVYNWQYVHCVDFWGRVLGGASSLDAQRENAGVESPLKPLIYPLTQIALGVVRYVSCYEETTDDPVVAQPSSFLPLLPTSLPRPSLSYPPNRPDRRVHPALAVPS